MGDAKIGAFFLSVSHGRGDRACGLLQQAEIARRIMESTEAQDAFFLRSGVSGERKYRHCFITPERIPTAGVLGPRALERHAVTVLHYTLVCDLIAFTRKSRCSC
jgi:hypothetical protein